MHERRKEKSLNALDDDNLSRNIGRETATSNVSTIKSYLQSLNAEELDNILVNRRSTKNLDGGPMIFDKKAPLGHPRKGFSVPKEIKGDKSKGYGIPSFHNVDQTPIKDLITNAFEKHVLLEKVQLRLVEEFRRK
jgi:hypothetical protein